MAAFDRAGPEEHDRAQLQAVDKILDTGISCHEPPVALDTGAHPSNTQRSPKILFQGCMSTHKKLLTVCKQALPAFTTYNILFALCLAFNAAFMVLAATQKLQYVSTHKAAFALGNIMVSVMVRNEVLLFGLYWLVVRLFSKWPPLWFRDFLMSFLLHIGGCHSGLAVSSLMWVIYVIIDLAQHQAFTQTGVIVVASCLGCFILLSIAATFPLLRFFHHNTFEAIHRFAGWSSLAALWVFVFLATNYNRTTKAYEITAAHMIHSQSFWFCLFTTYLILQPWLLTRKVNVDVIVPSRKAVLLKFQGDIPVGWLGRISRKPLWEWHAFGIISDGQEGSHYFLVTPLGDFTQSLITDPPTFVYTRIFRFVGLPYCVPLFHSGVAIATGSGLGICMSLFLQKNYDFHLVWIARDIHNAYGPIISRLLAHADPDKLHIYDSLHHGRPDALAMTLQLMRETHGEVVFVTSNPRGTRQIVAGCRSAGYPAFGPIWDS